MNTFWLGGRLFLSTAVAFFSTRIVLAQLGDVDYGIYVVLMGITGLIAFLNSAMSVTTLRFLAVGLGKNDNLEQKEIFRTSFRIHFGLSLIVIFLGLLIYFIGIEHVLNIPSERLFVAKVLFSMLIVQVGLAVLGTPFHAALNAHERMNWVAGLALFRSIVNLVWALSLDWSPVDILLWYAIGVTIGAVCVQLIAFGYAVSHFSECQEAFRRPQDYSRLLEMLNFSMWTFFGALAQVSQNQGLTIVLNRFFGTSVNAALGIANQIMNQLRNFSVSIFNGVIPQIMKSSGSNEVDRMFQLANWSAKYSTIILGLMILPAYLNMSWVLHVWLEKVPNYAVPFSQALLLLVLVNSLTTSYMSVVQANGNIRACQIVVGSLLVSAVPMAVFGAWFFDSPFAIPVASLLASIFATLGRLFFLKRIFKKSPLFWIKFVLIPCIKVFVPTSLLVLAFSHFNFSVFVQILLSFAFGGSVLWLWGMKQDERDRWNHLIRSLMQRILHN